MKPKSPYYGCPFCNSANFEFRQMDEMDGIRTWCICKACQKLFKHEVLIIPAIKTTTERTYEPFDPDNPYCN